jgi:hypothetical protein
MTPLRRDVLLSASSSSVPFAELGDTCANASIAPTEGIEALPSADVTETFGYAVKSVLDRIGACVLLLLLLPLMILIASVIRLESRGPALFAQERVGFRQQRFRCYKFRSMYHHMGDAQAILQTTRPKPGPPAACSPRSFSLTTGATASAQALPAGHR